MLRHLRDAIRQLRRAPLFTLTAVASLAIGIGANTAIFSVANALLIAPAPGVRNASRLVDIGRTTDGQGFDTVSFPTYRDLAEQVDVFDGVYALRVEPQALSLGSADGAERMYGEEVSASYFDVLGLVPAAGDVFHTREEQIGIPLRKVVLSDAFWRRRFQADPALVGRTLQINGDAFVVTGVAPRGFQGTTVLRPDVWVPLTTGTRGLTSDDTLRSRESVSFTLGARLKPGVSIDETRAAVTAFARRLAQTYPDIYRGRGLRVAAASRVPGLGEYVVPFIAVLMGLVGLVLLVACTNLTGLLLARAAARSREVAVRLALGASRRNVFGMLITESLVLFALGAVAAVGVGVAIMRVLTTTIGTVPMPVGITFTLDWRVLLFTSLLALATGLLTGAVPALQTARANLAPDLKPGATPRRQRLRHIFLAAQMACCLLLIVVAALFLRALTTAMRTDAGLQVDGVDIASVDLALAGYPLAEGPRAAEQLRARFAAIPGVAGVGVAAMVPLDGGGMGLGALRTPGTTDPRAFIDTDWNVVTPSYFDALRVPIVAGRNFGVADREGAPLVAIVNEHFARAVWPGVDPVGQVLENGDFRPGRGGVSRRLTVVGVARDAKNRWLGEAPAHFIYVPLAQQPMQSLHYFLRHADAATGSTAAAVRQALAGFDRNLPLVRFAPFRQFADTGLLPQRLAASIAGSLGVVALLLGAIGIYGVTAFAVTSRTREIGIRMALGADAARVLRSVLWHGLRLTAIGGAVGLAAAIAATRLLASLLFGISALDPIAFAGTTALLVGVAVVASWIPARRAARVNPVVALRTE
jgi:predicted permease